MQVLKIFYFCLIFPGVMYLLSLLGCSGTSQLAQNPGSFAISLILNFTASGLLSLVATYGLSIMLSVDPIRLFVFAAFNTTVIGFINSSIDNFVIIGAQSDVSVGFFALIKFIVIPAIVLVAGFQILFGSGWEGFK
jgi:hypothetical protein